MFITTVFLQCSFRCFYCFRVSGTSLFIGPQLPHCSFSHFCLVPCGIKAPKGTLCSLEAGRWFIAASWCFHVFPSALIYRPYYDYFIHVGVTVNLHRCALSLCDQASFSAIFHLLWDHRRIPTGPLKSSLTLHSNNKLL